MASSTAPLAILTYLVFGNQGFEVWLRTDTRLDLVWSSTIGLNAA